jgi:1-aminocyclopropane-1-carboxylate deaminase
MKLLFISREHYNVLSHNIELPNFPGIPANALIIPEGGYHSSGARGASLIMDKISNTNADFIVTAVGTATTYAGLLQKASAGQTIIAVPVLKNLADIPERLTYLNGPVTYPNTQIWSNYHFGGYAKKNSELIRFMNDFYVEYGIPSDFVYTAKMLFAVMDKIKNNQFPAGSRILCLHTGGLQGNNSLEKGTLVF